MPIVEKLIIYRAEKLTHKKRVMYLFCVSAFKSVSDKLVNIDGAMLEECILIYVADSIKRSGIDFVFQ